jgi:hypothetical protein
VIKACVISWIIGETVPLLFLLVYRYARTLSSSEVLGHFEFVLWPSSFLLAVTGGGDEGADYQVMGTAILLNAILYALLGTLVWFLFLRKRSSI